MRFRTIMADPPWDHNGDLAKASRPQWRGIGERETYPRMSVAEIAALPVPAVVADNAHLYLCVTNAALVAADTPVVTICRAWGFRPVTVITWVKHKRGEPGVPSMKVGRYFRGASEHIVFAVRGSTAKPDRAVPTWFGTERAPHSVKPDELFDLIESVSPGPRLELFARTRREGWTGLGNALDGRDIAESINKLVAVKQPPPPPLPTRRA